MRVVTITLCASALLVGGAARAQGATEAGTRGAQFGLCGDATPPRDAPYRAPWLPPPATPGACVAVGLEIFAQYGVRLTNTDAGETEWFHAFELTRGHAAITGRYGPVAGRFVFEAVRSASEGALLGVAGDSVVTRVREAFAQWTGLTLSGERALEVSGGVVPTLTIPEVEGTWGLRAVAPTPMESTGLSAPTDLGLVARFRAPRRYGWIGVGLFNGDGYTQRELNRGKNLEVAFSLHPLVSVRALAPLAVFGSYVMGSSGAGASRADRATAGLLWQGERLRAGASFAYAWGVDGDGDRRAWLLDAFVQGEPVARLLLGARVTRWVRDERAEGDYLTTILGAVGARVAAPFEVYLAAERWIPGARAVMALPGSDRWEIRAVSRVVF